MKKWAVAIWMWAAGSACANSACDQPKNNVDGQYCLNKVYQEADNERNANDGKLAAKRDAEGKKRLKAGQPSWIEERNSSCSRYEAAPSASTSSARPARPSSVRNSCKTACANA